MIGFVGRHLQIYVMDPTLAVSFQPQGAPPISAASVDGRSTPAIPLAKLSPPPTSPPGEPSTLPAPRREANSFADVTGDFTDLVFVERQRRLRRIVVGVMSGATGLLFLAGVCGLVRHASESDAPQSYVAPATLSIAETPSTPAPTPAASPDVALREADLAPAIAPRVVPAMRTRRPKGTPHFPRKTR